MRLVLHACRLRGGMGGQPKGAAPGQVSTQRALAMRAFAGRQQHQHAAAPAPPPLTVAGLHGLGLAPRLRHLLLLALAHRAVAQRAHAVVGPQRALAVQVDLRRGGAGAVRRGCGVAAARPKRTGHGSTPAALERLKQRSVSSPAPSTQHPSPSTRGPRLEVAEEGRLHQLVNQRLDGVAVHALHRRIGAACRCGTSVHKR